jgi:hypothetical protein
MDMMTSLFQVDLSVRPTHENKGEEMSGVMTVNTYEQRLQGYEIDGAIEELYFIDQQISPATGPSESRLASRLQSKQAHSAPTIHSCCQVDKNCDMDMMTSLFQVDLSVRPTHENKGEEMSGVMTVNTYEQRLQGHEIDGVVQKQDCVAIDSDITAQSAKSSFRTIFILSEREHARNMSSFVGDHIKELNGIDNQKNKLRISLSEDQGSENSRGLCMNSLEIKATSMTSRPRRSIFSDKEKISAMERAKCIW